MATTSIGTASGGDAVVFPQDRGTGLGAATDPDGVDAAGEALLAKYHGVEYHTASLTSNPATDTVDVSEGVAFIHDTSASTGGERDASGNPTVRETESTGHVTSVPDDVVAVVVIPTAKTGLAGAVDTAGQDVYLSYDPTAQNGVTLHHGAGIATPTEPYIKLGTFDSTSGGTATEANTHDGAESSVTSRTITSDLAVAHDESAIFHISTDDTVEVTGGTTVTVDSGGILATKEI